METKIPETRDELLLELETRIAGLRAALERNRGVITPECWIVVLPGPVYPGLRLTMKDNVPMVEADGIVGSPGLAKRWSRENAERIAARCTNGAGEKARAVPVALAIREAIEEAEGLIRKIVGLG